MNIFELLKIENLFTNPWGFNSDTLSELDYNLNLKKPKLILECGSGISTLILSNFCKESKGRLITLEHDEKYYNITLNLLKKYNLDSYVELYLCPLINQPPVYDFDFLNLKNQKIDFVLIDGPPEGTGGRYNIFPWLMDYLNNNWEIWLDDGNRKQELEAIEYWKTLKTINIINTNLMKDVKIITNKINYNTYNTQDISDVCISILSGNRPQLLKKTLDSLPLWLLENNKNIIGLCNGGDLPTLKIFKSFKIETIITDKILPIGDSISLLSKYIKMMNKTYWLHLEDDWLFNTLDDNWIFRSKKVLNYCEQVRLRKYSEKVLTTNLITNELINWNEFELGLISENAHFTFNPSLIKCDDIDLIFPCTHENDCCRKAIKNNFIIYQLYPGCFKHIGHDNSLRLKNKVINASIKTVQNNLIKIIEKEKIIFDNNFNQLLKTNNNLDVLIRCKSNLNNLLTYLNELQ